jgi:hypothetical protein
VSTSNYVYDLLHPDLVDILAFRKATSPTGLGRSTATAGDQIAEPSIAWQEMSDDWLVIRDLLGGTRGMRLARERYLPKFPREKPSEYQHRLDTSFLIDMLDATIDEMVAKPFSKAVSFKGTVPEWVEELNKNVDGRGTTIHEYAKNLLTDAARWGKSHLAVDAVGMPAALPETPQVRDYEGVRPRMRLIPGPNVLHWRTEAGVVYSARWYEREVDGSAIIESMHVWDGQTFKTYRRNYTAARFEEAQDLQRPNLAGELTIVPFYTKKTGEFCSKPPFMDLAWVNVDHWQSYSDQRQILQTARVPMLFKKGFRAEEIDSGPQVIGSRRIHSTTEVNADMRYVEPSGTAMNEGREHLKMLADAAREKGSKPMQERGPVTATGEVRADSKATCDLQAWCEALERVLRRAYEMCVLSVPSLEPLPEDFQVRIHTEFDLRDRSAQDLAGLRSDRARRDISREAYISEAKRRGLLPEDFDMEADKVLLDQEAADGMGEGDTPGGTPGV